MKREYRVISGAQFRASGDAKSLAGYAAVFNQLSEDLGGFREMVRPGAFKRCLDSGPDVRCLFNHNSSVVLGRTKAGTLSLAEDDQGLSFYCDMPETQAARDLMQSVGRGDIDQCSFGFIVNQDNWSEGTDSAGRLTVLRELLDVELFDVSPVTYPAYPQTSVSARSLWPDGKPEGLEDRLREAQTPAAPAPPAPAPVEDYTAEARKLAAEVLRRMETPATV